MQWIQCPSVPPLSAHFPQVCGSDMMTYPTACHLYKKACDMHRMVFPLSFGPCEMSKCVFQCENTAHGIFWLFLTYD